MKVLEATGSESKTTSKIDLEIDNLPRSIRDDIIQETGELLVEQVLLSMADAKSPVSGEKFPALTKAYKAKKVALGGQPKPDLELTGELKDALTFRKTKEGLEIGFFGSQSDKADGHLKFSGRENFTPQRRFLPAEGQKFNDTIEAKVQSIIDDKSGDMIGKAAFEGVDTTSELYDVLSNFYSDMTRSEIRFAVASSSSLMDILIELDLVDLL